MTWRVGKKLGRTLYRDEVCVGMVDTPETAADIILAMTLFDVFEAMAALGQEPPHNPGMTRASERHREQMASVLSNMAEQNLDRAHIITAFFWAGVASGYRMRRSYDAAFTRETGQALANSLGLHRDDPFCVGWGFGWDFEEGKDDGK